MLLVLLHRTLFRATVSLCDSPVTHLRVSQTSWWLIALRGHSEHPTATSAGSFLSAEGQISHWFNPSYQALCCKFWPHLKSKVLSVSLPGKFLPQWRYYTRIYAKTGKKKGKKRKKSWVAHQHLFSVLSAPNHLHLWEGEKESFYILPFYFIYIYPTLLFYLIFPST